MAPVRGRLTVRLLGASEKRHAGLDPASPSTTPYALQREIPGQARDDGMFFRGFLASDRPPYPAVVVGTLAACWRLSEVETHPGL